jgi:hypothetical protein
MPEALPVTSGLADVNDAQLYATPRPYETQGTRGPVLLPTRCSASRRAQWNA